MKPITDIQAARRPLQPGRPAPETVATIPEAVPAKGAAPKEGPADLAEAIDNLPMSG